MSKQVFAFRLPPDEWQMIRCAAEAEAVTPSELARAILVPEITRRIARAAMARGLATAAGS